MGCQTLLLEFKLDSNYASKDGCDNIFTKIIRYFENQLSMTAECVPIPETEKVSTRIFTFGENLLTARLYKETSLLTISLDGPFLCPSTFPYKNKHVETDSRPSTFASYADVVRFENDLKELLSCQFSKSLPAITRGIKDSPYMTTTDDRWIEAPIVDLLFEKQSEFQKIQIFDTVDFGRMLVLDDQVNLAERDLVYTYQMIKTDNIGKKKVLILGGGDCGILHELLRLSTPPEQIIMVELDNDVMEAVMEYMPSVCGGSKIVRNEDQDPRYEVIVGDALHYLEECVQAGAWFDLIISDLTDIPIQVDSDEKIDFEKLDQANEDAGKDIELWKLLGRAFSLSLKCLPVGGRFHTHLTGKSQTTSIQYFEDMVDVIARAQNTQVKTKLSEVFVPSFMEPWVFAHITKLDVADS